ncbi:MAG TPA: T9SS type A sorting domain-containing protein, partial [Bacteroidia bacterium]|nr:T9SS type A sorting domain-containing protein [Bacteroidia bacterium]
TAAGTSNQYCNQGLYLQQGGVSSGAYSSVPQDAIAITTNSITNCAINDIAINTVTTPSTATKGFIDIYQNTELSIQYNSAATTTVSPHRAAVFITGSNRIKVTDNANIKCTGLTSYTNTAAQYIAGVYVSTSPSSTVNCNTVNYMGEDFVWEGNSTGSQWRKNNMHNSRYGLVLRSSGIMGDQGSSSLTIGDNFGPYSTDILSAHTLVDNSSPWATSFSSKLYCYPSACTGTVTLPCQNNNVGSLSSYTTGGTYTSLYSFTASGSNVCAGDGIGGRMAGNHVMSDSTAADSILLVLEGIISGIENNPPFPIYDLQTRWSLQYYVTTQNDSLPAAIGYENAKTFAQIDAAIGANNYSTAQSLLNSVTSNNIVEDNWYAVDNLLVKLQSDTLTGADRVILQSVAEQCPLVGGNIVYQARAMLYNYYKHILTYADNCSDNGNISRKANIQSTNAKAATSLFDAELHPNPNIGSEVFINTMGLANGNINIKMADLEGRIVYENESNVSGGIANFKLTEIKNGVYFVIITNIKTGEKAVKKLIIQY